MVLFLVYLSFSVLLLAHCLRKRPNAVTLEWEEYVGCQVGFEFEANHMYVKAAAKDVLLESDDLDIHADTIHNNNPDFRSVEFVTRPSRDLNTILSRVWKAEQVADNLGQAALASKTGWVRRPTRTMGGEGLFSIQSRDSHPSNLTFAKKTFLFEDKLGMNFEADSTSAMLWSASPQVSRGVPLHSIPAYFQKAYERSGSEGAFAKLAASLTAALSSLQYSEAPVLEGAMFYVASTAYQLTNWPKDQGQEGEGPKAAFSVAPLPRTSFRAVFQKLLESYDANKAEEALLLGACMGRALGLHNSVAMPHEALKFRNDRLIRKKYVIPGELSEDTDLTIKDWVASMRSGRGVGWLEEYDVLRDVKVSSGATFDEWAHRGDDRDKMLALLDSVGLRDRPLIKLVDHRRADVLLPSAAHKGWAEPLMELLMLLRYADEDFMSPPPGLEGFSPRYSLGAMGLDGECVVMEERAVVWEEGDLGVRDGSWQEFAEYVLGVDDGINRTESRLEQPFEVVAGKSKQHRGKRPRRK